MPRGPHIKTNTHQMLPSQFLKPFIFQLTRGKRSVSSRKESFTELSYRLKKKKYLKWKSVHYFFSKHSLFNLRLTQSTHQSFFFFFKLRKLLREEHRASHVLRQTMVRETSPALKRLTTHGRAACPHLSEMVSLSSSYWRPWHVLCRCEQ